MDSIRNLLEATRPSDSNSKMRFSSCENVLSSVSSRHEKVPVELRCWPCARNASLRLSAASSCARSIAMLAICVTCPISSCTRGDGVAGLW